MNEKERAIIINALLAIHDVLSDVAPGHTVALCDVKEAAQQLRDTAGQGGPL